MLSFNILVYAVQCRECGTFNRHIVIVAGDDENKTEAIMKARFLQCKHCRHKLISSKERKIPETIFLIRNKRTVDFQVDNKTRELAFLKSPYHILIDLNELQKAGFLGIVQIKGRENTSSVYHILENRIIPFHFRNENRENEPERPESTPSDRRHIIRERVQTVRISYSGERELDIQEE